MIRILPLVVITATAALIPQNPPSKTPPTPTGQDYTKDLNTSSKSSDNYLATWLVLGSNNEVALAQLALQKATDPEVKQFAQRMIDDHGTMAEKLQPFATCVGVGGTGVTTGSLTNGALDDTRLPRGEPAPASFGTEGGMEDFDHVGLLRELSDQCLQSARTELSQKSGAEFDRCYMGFAIGEHMKANDMLTVFQRHASGTLKPVLSDGQRTVQAHLQQAKDLAKRMEAKMMTRDTTTNPPK